MPWLRPQLLLLLLILAILGPPGYYTDSDVGCLFSESICLEDELCYDDLAFGRCISSNGNLKREDIYRYDLNQETLFDLNKEINRLFALGYRWGHPYTQCRLQGMLFALKYQVSFDPDSCYDLTDNDLEGALRVLEQQVEIDPNDIAIIKYAPSVENPPENYDDNAYYPLEVVENNIKPSQQLNRKEMQARTSPTNQNFEMMDYPYSQYYVSKRGYVRPIERQADTPFLDGRSGNHDSDPRSVDSLEFLPQYDNDFPVDLHPAKSIKPEHKKTVTSTIPEEKMFPLINLMNRLELWPKDLQRHIKPSNYRKILKIVNRLQQSNEGDISKEDLYRDVLRRLAESEENRDSNSYGTSDRERALAGSNDYNDYIDGNDILLEPRIYYDEDEDNVDGYEYGSGKHPEMYELLNEQKQQQPQEMTDDEIAPRLPRKEFFRELIQQPFKGDEPFNRDYRRKTVVYSEGGEGEETLKGDNDESQLENEFATLDDLNVLDKYNIGFKRPERKDVKKPGPPFDPSIIKAATKKKKFTNDILPSMIKKEPRGVYPNYNYEMFHNRDGDGQYIYINFTNTLNDWGEAQNIIKVMAKLLHMEPNDFRDGQIRETTAVSFRVLPTNYRGYNASIVAKRIEYIKDDIEKQTHFDIVSIGIGNKNNMSNVVFNRINTENQYIVIFLVCGILVALILATIVLLLIGRHVKSKEKLHAISRPDTEASKDYQDLCRVRMATKGQAAAEVIHGKGRITSLSRESERESPSSRSSTSSWSEEPALHNMDISTGHMVLSYMEDHLKNKDRLDQEWIALCFYVAEPCETVIALKKENVEKNRNLEIIPYDHARVILNELTNVHGSDYINASSITDHDPRNPAYIATQGPLPQTVPDFWQLIWEQGAVVIVMLTRLTECGNAMCHRYWPEEGSEVYHIYEVHLVSEHIWCDDYLVRSFYLKNIRTGETRTVTQFHFLSWPEASVPVSTKALLEFRRKVNKSYRGRSCPIVVHCSDGAGRTGTYCLIDMVLSRMAKGAKEIDIAATLEHLTDQRPKMVATKQQFEFVLTAVAEEVHAILKALPAQPVGSALTPQPSTTQG